MVDRRDRRDRRDRQDRQDRVIGWARSASSGEHPAVPAGTVVLVRDGGGGIETLMVHKDSRVAFGGMWVFPGGRVDEDDRAAGDDLAAARRAAAREALEECALPVDEEELLWISFWVPPPEAPRRFATWFFVAPAPDGTVTVDDGEIRDHRWLRPAHALALRDEGEIELAPPTWMTLRWVSEHARVADLVRAAGDGEPRRYETHVAVVEGGAVALWEGDAGYESGDPDAPGARHRLWLTEGAWRYEHSGG